MEIDILKSELEAEAKRKPFAVVITKTGGEPYTASRFALFNEALDYCRYKISYSGGGGVSQVQRVDIEYGDGTRSIWDASWGEEWSPDKIR